MNGTREESRRICKGTWEGNGEGILKISGFFPVSSYCSFTLSTKILQYFLTVSCKFLYSSLQGKSGLSVSFILIGEH